jgi:GrpB-like predicted nucleotidyltransferase (UPF0157 family)
LNWILGVTGKAGRQKPRPPEANIVVRYDRAWPVQYEAIRMAVAPAFTGTDIAIEHVGSTAVPGLAAKPVIDVDVVVPTEADIAGGIRRLVTLGYVHRGDLGVPGRQALDAPEHLPYHHLYLVVRGSRPHLDHVLFRDYLRAHPEDAERYASCKFAAAHLITTESREAYMEAKAKIVEEVLARAHKEH